MPTPKLPRPATIVAAAVLLIVIGCELLLAFAAIVTLCFFQDWQTVSGEAKALLAGTAFLGGYFLGVGIQVLRGRLVEAWTNGYRIMLYGTMAMWLIAIFGWLILQETVKWKWNELLTLLLIVTPFAMNTIALFTAGSLLLKYSDRYHAWQAVMKVPRKDPEYEADTEVAIPEPDMEELRQPARTIQLEKSHNRRQPR